MEYRDQNFGAVGAQIACLSVDEPVRAEAMRVKLRLPFPVLCDSGREVVKAWGLFNAEENGGIAYPAIFVLDVHRKVRYRSLDRTASRVSPAAVMAFLKDGRESSQEEPKRQAIWPGLGNWVTAIKNALRYGIRIPKQ